MEVPTQLSTKRRKKNLRNLTASVSFSASLPEDVGGAFSNSICAVKYSTDPFLDIRQSIIEMIQGVGVRDWDDMEELIYCYIVLNPSEVHDFILEAFLSLLSCSAEVSSFSDFNAEGMSGKVVAAYV
ncbi:hypothetical protein RJ639_001097 [Escallonia herrerae]|uniref:Transcription repressor n=1 Tax=Escallonia herrerae TaxID=1293975 RepID=A0AA89BGD8_9ASTE|nr:hypothetical protein RJ639_001097 [Escallonia herrerae]